jgi:actin-related protein 8
MRFYKLRVTQNASLIASTFNESFKPEILPDDTDPYKIEWITESNEEFIVGEKVSVVLHDTPSCASSLR